MKNKNGLIIYEGLSPIDNKPIVLIATGLGSSKSSNPKTGHMVQTWILRQDIKPNEGHKNGENRSVCGNCPHAGYNQGSCYVRWFQAPLSVWECYKRGNYEYLKDSDLDRFNGVALRMGSAGDPAVIGLEVWKKILNRVRSHTGYTHQWRTSWGQEYKGILQASCDSLLDYVEASSHGWKCFSVKHKDTPAPKGSINCPASNEQKIITNNSTPITCSSCTLCDGNTSNVFINAHGNTSNRVLVEVKS